MKTSRCLIRQLSLVAGGLLFCIPASFAAPGNGTATGAAPTAGGRTVSSAPSTAHSSGATFGGSRSASSANGSSFRSSTGSVSNFRQTLSTAPAPVHYTGGGYVAKNPNPGQRLGSLQPGNLRTSPSLPTVNNAWTDPNNTHVTGGPRVGVNSTSNHPNQATDNIRVGNTLYPGAYGYVPSRPANLLSQHERHGGENYHGRRHYDHNSLPYTVYYPYPYNSYGYGGYGTDGNLSYGSGPADYAGQTAASSTIDLGAPDFSTTQNNYYSYTAPEENAPDQPATQPVHPLPDAPAVGPQSPASSEKSADTSQGPDSLVEAVQLELARRGYFGGQPDAMYGAATKEAIRRFQMDQHLPATGRVNEATLHALHLD